MDSTLFAFLYLMFFTYGILKITLYQWTKILLLFTATQYSTVWMYNNLCKQSCGWKANVFLNGVSMSDSVIWLYQFSSVQFSSVQSLSRVRIFATPWIAARQASLSITNSQSSLRLTSIESVMPSSHLILGRPLLLLPPITPSIRVFSNESTLCMRWPKYWSFSFSIIPSKESQDWSPSEWTCWISLQFKGLSRVFSNTKVQTHQLFGTQPFSQSNSHIHTWLLENHSLD